MENITYLELQNLIKKIPKTKLSIAYNLLKELTVKETSLKSPQIDYMSYSKNERCQLLEQQAEQMKAHYEQNISNRDEWQVGDFIDKY